MFDLDSPFEIRDDIEILKRMGLAFGLENGVCGPEVGRRLVGQCGWRWARCDTKHSLGWQLPLPCARRYPSWCFLRPSDKTQTAPLPPLYPMCIHTLQKEKKN